MIQCSFILRDGTLWFYLQRQKLLITFLFGIPTFSGPGSSVGIATGYGLEGPGIESRWGREFPHLSRPALGLNQPPVQWVPGFPGVKNGRGVTLTTYHLLLPWSRKSRAILLLPLWAIRPLESLSACKWVHFTFLPFRPLKMKPIHSFEVSAGNYLTKRRHTPKGHKPPKQRRVNIKQLSGEALFLFQTICFGCAIFISHHFIFPPTPSQPLLPSPRGALVTTLCNNIAKIDSAL